MINKNQTAKSIRERLEWSGKKRSMKNYASRKTVKRGGTRFRTPSLFLVRKAEAAKRLRQPIIIKGRPGKA